ncbi:MAG TPA: hypothetical protein VFS92_02480 [Planctomycetota bacterium]|nr:hypothetical protein [Planctomycetota bacterium]
MRFFGLKFQRRAITSPDRPDGYLLRWEVETPWFGVKLHKFLRSDAAPLHDHPWDFVSIILWGRYREFLAREPADTATPTVIERGWLSFAKRRATDRHRVELVEEKPVWTLCVSGPRRRDWYFYPIGPFAEPIRVPWRVLTDNGEQLVEHLIFKEGWEQSMFDDLDRAMREQEAA